MADCLHCFLAQLLNDYFDLLWLVYQDEINVKMNGGEYVNISEYGFKLERVLKRPVGHGEISESIRRLCKQGFLVTSPSKGGSKLVKLSPEAKQIFGCFDSISEALK